MVQKFLDAVRNDPKAKELIKSMPVPKNDAEAAEGYVKIAKELGFDLTADEILAGLKGMEQAQKAQSDKVSLDDVALEHVTGGVQMPDCASTYESDGEWCWFSDSCSYIISYYDKPSKNPAKKVLMNTAMIQGIPSTTYAPSSMTDSFGSYRRLRNRRGLFYHQDDCG